MESDIFVLPLEAAKDCLAFTEAMLNQNKKVKETMDIPEQFTEDLNGFYSFMQIAVNAGFKSITIPDHHHAICTGLVRALLLSSVLGSAIRKPNKE